MKLFNRFKKSPGPFNKFDWIVLGGSGLIFSLLSLTNMARFSVWFYEAFGLYLIRSDYWDVAKLTAVDVHPPMYYWFLKFWTSIFGTSEIGARSLSLFLMLVAFVFIYLLVRKFFGQKAAGFSIILLAICPLLFRYSTEARMYGMTTAIVAASTYVLVSAMEKSKRWKWVAYGLLVSLGLWTHYFTAVAFAAQWVWRYIVVRKKGDVKDSLRRFFSKDWIFAYVVALAAYTPWIYFAVKQLVTVQGGGFWISPITPASPLGFASDVLMYRTNSEALGWYAVLLWVIVALAAVLAVRAYQTLAGSKKKYFWLLVSMAFVPLALIIVASMPPLRSALVNRYIMPSVAFSVALLGVTISLTIGNRKKWNKLAGALLVLIVGAMMSGIVYVYQVGNMNKDSGNDTQPIWPTLQQVWQNSKVDEPTLVGGVTRYYEVAYYEDRAPVGTGVFFVGADNLTWGSYEPIRNKSAKVQDVVDFARRNGGALWYIGDWSNEGQPSLPKVGNWKVLREVHAPTLPNGKSSVRAVEIQLVD
jgi:4-amino-4-deoxy-L-arabinose transferase-like glycosyltransferase